VSRPLRTAFLSSCVRGGGAGWSLFYLLKNIDRSRFEPVPLLPDAGVFTDRYADLGIEVTVVPDMPERLRGNNATGFEVASNALKLASAARWVERFLRDQHIDLLYCNNMMVKPVGALAAEQAAVPCVLHARNLHEKRTHVMGYGTLARLPAVKRVIANSIATAVPYQRAAPNKVRVVYNGVDLDEYTNGDFAKGVFREELGLSPEKTVVGFTGWLQPRKGVDTLIKAASLLTEGRPHVVVVFVGTAPPDADGKYVAQCERLVEELGLANRVIFAGFRRDVRPAVSDFDVLCLPSRQEPFGRSIVEAMALGKPVVASAVGGIPEVITDGVDGLLVPPDDPDALAEALSTVVDDAEFRVAIGKQALQTIRKRFDVAVLTRQIESVLTEAASFT
jgi:glycosyltransferase involved in cell wall biosynthesis